MTQPAAEQSPADPERSGGPTGRPRRLVPGAPRPELAQASTAEIIAELGRRQERVVALRQQQDSLRRELAEIDLHLARIADTPLSTGVPTAATPVRSRRTGPRQGSEQVAGEQVAAERGGTGDGRRRRRVRNETSLVDALAAAIEPGASVSPSEAARLVRKRGYLSNARNFPMMVSHALTSDPRFRRVSRGSYLRLPDDAPGH